MSDRIDALVNPHMLVWARETAGFDVHGVARRMKVKPEKVEEWESGAARPTILQAMSLAEIYRRPLSAFYLAAPPIPKCLFAAMAAVCSRRRRCRRSSTRSPIFVSTSTRWSAASSWRRSR